MKTTMFGKFAVISLTMVAIVPVLVMIGNQPVRKSAPIEKGITLHWKAIEPTVKPPKSYQHKITQRPYTIKGMKYKPIHNHEGFTQTGLASWYGGFFHGRKTSNGEIYDMHGMSAAHKTLPLGVFVRVKNVENGKEITVRVNDRGPFVKGRIIDLSLSAAKSLGVAKPGTAPVKIEALGFLGTGKEQYTLPKSYEIGKFTVQVGAFINLENAKELHSKMEEAYGFSQIRSTWIKGQKFYRVYSGKHKSLKAAEKSGKKLEKQYPDSFVVALDFV